MTDIVFTTVNLPPAVLGVPYEAAIAYKGAASAVTTQNVTAGNNSGLPAGLAIDSNGSAPGSLRITGTPTGAASTPNGTGTAISGSGVYTFEVTAADTAGSVTSSSYTITLYGTEGDYEKVAVSDTPSAAAAQLWPLGI